ncbi:hypothetical protein ACYJ1Y_05485 [Natrialbaceae archaeon A-gly3]
MARTLTIVAVGLIVLGAMAMVGPTFGFSTIAGDRGVNVNTADDSSALLGIEETGDTPDNQNDVDVIEITNNAGEDYETLDTEVTIDDPNDALAISNDFDESLPQGEVTGLELTCEGGGDGEATVSVGADASGSTIQIEDVSFSTTFEYSCIGGGNTDPGDGFDSVSVDNVVENTAASQQDQTIAFTPSTDLSNKEEVTIDLSSAHPDSVDYANVEIGDITVESGNGQVENVDIDDNNAVITYEGGQGNSKDQAGNEIEITVTNFETFDSDGPFEVTFDREDATDTGMTEFFVEEQS